MHHIWSYHLLGMVTGGGGGGGQGINGMPPSKTELVYPSH